MFLQAPDPAAMVDQMAKTARLQRLLFGAEQAEAAGKLSHAQVILETRHHSAAFLACSCLRSHHACMLMRSRQRSDCVGRGAHSDACLVRCLEWISTQDLWLELRGFLAAEAADNPVTAAHATPLLDACGHRLTGLLSRVLPSQ